MAMIVFSVLSGLGVAFMLYVLVEFVKEGRRSKNPAGDQNEIELAYMSRPELFIVTHPISHSAQGGLCVIPMQPRKRTVHGKKVRRGSADEIIEMPLTRRERKNVGATIRSIEVVR